jgi:hypothetical protein
MSPLRRYAPFAMLVAAQIVLVLVAPSRAGTSATPIGGQFTGSSVPGASTPAGGVPTAGSGLPAGPSGGSVPSAAASGPSAGAGPVTSSGQTSSGAATKRGVLPAASGTSTGKPFCISGLMEHPPCIAQWAGGNNGGATWQGVTATTIKIVMYRPKANAAVDAILRSTGTYIDPATEKQQFLLVSDWLNKHDQLYGRKIQPIYVQGNCDIAPPVDSCFRNDADSLVAQYKPFAVFWDSDTNEAAFFDEISRKGVVNWGGWGFADAFSNNLRPYHYDLFMSGDVQAEFAGQWYCKRLAGHKAEYAGDSTLRNTVRKVSVTYPDTPQTTPAAQHLMRIIAGCAGKNAVVDGKYSSDTSTAAQQATTNTAKMKSQGVTTFLWMSDPIAPAYGTKAQAAQNYFPEEALAGGMLLDYDALAQAYDQTEWAHAFGPSDLGATTPVDQEDCDRIWKAEGMSGHANPSTNLGTSYELAIAMGITAAGPKLTPLTFEYGLLTAPGYDQWSKWHDPRLVYLDWARGDYSGISDVREVYYSATKTSPLNGRNGTYIAVNGGTRYQLADLPSGEPQLPSGV